MRNKKLGLAALAVSLTAGSSAFAADPVGFDLQQFVPAPAGDHFFGVPDAAVGKGPNVGLLGNLAFKPLSIRDRGKDEIVSKPSKMATYAHIEGSYAISNRLLISVGVPVALAQSGDDQGANAQVAVKGGKLGDVRAGLRFAFVEKGAFVPALAVDVQLPTGNDAALTGDKKLRVNPKLVFSGDTGSLVYTFNVGYLFRGNKKDLGTPEIGDALTFGAGVAAVAGNFQIGPEIYGNTVTKTEENPLTNAAKDNLKLFGKHSTPLEALLGAKLRVNDLVLGLGAGPGLSKNPGTPAFRVVAGVALVPQIVVGPGDRDGDGITDDKDACPDVKGVASADPKLNGCPPAPKDRDGDGIVDDHDACPDVPGVANADPKKNGCPSDRDNDGVLDKDDACPDVAGVATSDPATNGCPPDKDGDGIPDAQDACPDVKGVKSDDPKKNGCPPDTDGDGIPDPEDACPDKPGIKSDDPKQNGCPAKAAIIGKSIKITEQVKFDTGKATIRSESDALLGDVAKILKDHPEITLINIEGHTDNVGNKAANKTLSQNRANAVKTWLTKKGGIDAKRLKATGYGQEKPVDSNDTDAGRQNNRRVEFNIPDAAGDKPAAAPAHAPAPAKPAKPVTPPKKKTK